jgi:hypothetical protein
MGLNLNRARVIYREMLWYRSFPEELFIGTEPQKQPLRRQLAWSPWEQ